MTKDKKGTSDGDEAGLGGFLGGLGTLIEKLGELAEKGKDLHELKEFGDDEKLQGVYGFSIKTNVGEGRDGGAKVEPFGNVRKDEQTGRASVHEEP